VEGISRALRVFTKKMEAPIYTAVKPGSIIKTIVKATTKGVRPYVVTAVLRDVSLSQSAYDSLIDLQEKLHHNICRKRSLVAIGVHDLDTLSPPFVYSADAPEEITFLPLNQKKSFRADELMVHYQSDNHIKHYLHLIKDEPLFPVIRDSNGVVLSMPPIINGNHSRVNVNTKNLFFECTATDLTKATIVLDILITMLSEHCKAKFTAELTEVIYEDEGSTVYFPVLKYRKETVSRDLINSVIGINLSTEEMAQSLDRMCLKSRVESNNQASLEVEVPPTRHDVIHAADIIEDVAIAYGYDNIVKTLPATNTISSQLPLNKLTDQLRESIAQAGFTEALTFSLCSVEDECEKVRHSREIMEPQLARVANPKTLEFQAARHSLLSGLLKTLQANKKMPLPLKLFEISDVVLLDSSVDTGSKNERRLCAVFCNKSPGFEVIHGLLDRIMLLLEVPYSEQDGYYIKASEDPTYFDGRCAVVLHRSKVIGRLGVLHPEVLSNFELSMPCSAVEISIEDFV
jgi:phenylalanyl-tRNA synthetase beta chain